MMIIYIGILMIAFTDDSMLSKQRREKSFIQLFGSILTEILLSKKVKLVKSSLIILVNLVGVINKLSRLTQQL